MTKNQFMFMFIFWSRTSTMKLPFSKTELPELLTKVNSFVVNKNFNSFDSPGSKSTFVKDFSYYGEKYWHIHHL